jgi:hypothetical protein
MESVSERYSAEPISRTTDFSAALYKEAWDTPRTEPNKTIINKRIIRKTGLDVFAIDDMPDYREANLVFGGERAKAIWSTRPVVRVAGNQWQVDLQSGAQQLVAEYDSGIFVPLLAYHEMTTIAVRDGQGTNGWLLASPSDPPRYMRRAFEILERMQSGDLRPSEVDKITDIFRTSKHSNPVIGAVCAYLYDYAGDLDNIRRMAFYYADWYYQPIPYDIVLMGELQVHTDYPDSRACVPAVEQSQSPENPDRPDFVRRATRAVNGRVGGFCPWLRQGWDFIDTSTGSENSLGSNLSDIRQHLLPETFTALGPKGGEMVTSLWRMQQWH